MEKKHTASDKGKKIAQLHWKIQQWKLQFQLMDNEIDFMKKLLDSNAFRSNIPNLFERLQDSKARLEEVHARSEATRTRISMHENNLGAEDNAISADMTKMSDDLQLEVEECMGNYHNLKSEIFNYTGSILIMNKPELK
mgnify:CR=1 FL=1